ncbi:MAG: 50S ribosomal protein L6 [Myxococcaceae bacterium]|nr:50S ribosomal protein L6 [Myxococcaceae bacterium]MCA3013389.1 50S ribosomal protein L6 [Myxococcaceae bacterium]
MSRIGKLSIKVEEKVKVSVAGGQANLEGPKGKLSVVLHPDVKVEVKEGAITVSRPSDSRKHRALHGLTRAILANAMKGVAVGWERALAIRGVGYKAEVKGKQLHLSLGFSHPVVFDLPEGVTAEVAKTPRTEDQLPTIDVTLRSADRQLLGETAVRIRNLRPPEPYKGKGIKLHDETVRRKEGKTGTA